MGYVATEREQRDFEDIHRELRRFINSYQTSGIKLDVPWGLWMSTTDRTEYYDFPVQKKLGPFRRTILVISPPYTARDVDVHDKKYHDLGEKLQDVIAKYWTFGRQYKAYGDEGEMSYKGEIIAEIMRMIANQYEPQFTTRIMHEILNDFNERPRKDSIRTMEKLAILEVNRRRMKELLESRN